MTSIQIGIKSNSQTSSRLAKKANSNQRSGWFSFLLAQKPLVRSDSFMIHVLFSKKNKPIVKGSKNFSLGVLVPKKLVSRAVDRNAIKRIIRMQWFESAQSIVSSSNFVVLVRFTKSTSSVTYRFKHCLNQELKSVFLALIEKIRTRFCLESGNTNNNDLFFKSI